MNGNYSFTYTLPARIVASWLTDEYVVNNKPSTVWCTVRDGFIVSATWVPSPNGGKVLGKWGAA